MNSRHEYPFWPAHAALRARAREWEAQTGAPSQAVPPQCTCESCRGAVASEWAERPLGRLGRRLLLEIETYVEFFAIARGAA